MTFARRWRSGYTSSTALSGFTLIEVLVALLIGGMAVATAAALLLGLDQRASAIRRSAARVDHSAEAERVLRQAIANVDATVDSTTQVVTGSPDTAQIHTWCETPAGPMVRCVMKLWFAGQSPDKALRADWSSGVTRSVDERLVLYPGLTSGSFRYLIDPADGGHWKKRWSRRLIPGAIEIDMGPDTLLLPTSGHG